MTSVSSVFARMFHTYSIHVKAKNPVKTKMATCFVLFALGDITC